MIKVDGGYASIVNVESEFENGGSVVALKVRVRMYYADVEARNNLNRKLMSMGFRELVRPNKETEDVLVKCINVAVY